MSYGAELKNPIEVWFDSPAVVEAKGTTQCLMSKRKCLSLTRLDPHVDELPPDWVIDILTLTPLSYKARCKVIVAHCENIAKAKGLAVPKPNRRKA